MKKSLLALSLIALCACSEKSEKKENASAEQTPPTATVKIASIAPSIFNYWDRDSEEFAVESECTEKELLADTANLYPVEKSLKNISSQTGHVFLEFSDDLFSRSLVDSSCTYYMQTHKARLNNDTDLSVRLYDSTHDYDKIGEVKFYVKGDTIYTLNFAADSGGFSPEGLTFKISGDGVADVTASYSIRYDATVFNPRKYRHIEGNRVCVCNLATEELPLAVEDGRYTLPVVKTLELTASDWQKMEELRPGAIRRWENWSGEKMDTTYLVHIFDLDHFLINLSVTYKDGSVRTYRHMAQGITSEP